jgi:hypothetical protein
MWALSSEIPRPANANRSSVTHCFQLVRESNDNGLSTSPLRMAAEGLIWHTGRLRSPAIDDAHIETGELVRRLAALLLVMGFATAVFVSHVGGSDSARPAVAVADQPRGIPMYE